MACFGHGSRRTLVGLKRNEVEVWFDDGGFQTDPRGVEARPDSLACLNGAEFQTDPRGVEAKHIHNPHSESLAFQTDPRGVEAVVLRFGYPR